MGVLSKSMYKLKQNSIKKGKHYKKKKGINGEVWVFDFETLTFFTETFKKTNDTQIILWAGRRVNIKEEHKESGDYIEYIPQRNKANGTRKRQEEIYTTDKFVVGTSADSFLDFILNAPKNTLIYFHNLAYDGTFIIPILSRAKELEQVHFEMEDNGLCVKGIDDKGQIQRNHWDLFRNGRKIFKICLRKQGANSNLINIEFRCTSLMLSSSVEKLGECLGKAGETFMNKPLSKFLEEEKNAKQHNNNFYNVEPYENIEDMRTKNIAYFNYCLRDVEIVRRHYIYFRQMINELKTVQIAVKEEREEHNKRQEEKGNTGRNGKYKEGGMWDIWKSISVAGGMRKLLKEVYIPYYQAINKQYAINTRYLHNKELQYGNFANVPLDTHRFFTTPRNMFRDEVISKSSKFFRGGFTQLNTKLQNLEKATDVGDCGKWDISSAYPYQMSKPLPFGHLISEEEFNDNYQHLKEGEYYEFLEIPIDKATPKPIAEYCATLPNLTEYRDENKARHRYMNKAQERFTLCVVKEEWEELKHWYDFKIETYEIKRTYMLAAPFLRDISIELYNEKERYDALGMQAQKQGAKIAINSVYGSLGIREQFDSLIYVPEETADQLDKTRPQEFNYEKGGTKCTSCDVKHKSKDIKTDKYWGLYIRENKESKNVWNVAAAAVITALERVYLMQTIRRVGAQHFGYCDTDSIIFVNLTPEARETMETIEKERPLKQVLKGDSKYEGIDIDLGNWEVEYRYIKGFIPHKAKEYTQEIYAYDEKRKTFLDNEGNPCAKENAKIIRKSASAGFVLPGADTDEGQRLQELFYSSLSDRATLSDEDIKEIYKEIKDIDSDFCNRIRAGETLINNGDKITLKCNSGDVLIWKNKWTRYGTN